MSRRLQNWSYRQVTDFLMGNGFSFQEEIGGSHHAWIKKDSNGKILRRVIMYFRKGNQSYHVKSLTRIIKQSGIPKTEWIKWGDS